MPTRTHPPTPLGPMHPVPDTVRDRSGFFLRGREMTRIETFTDAAFAFAVTLLVISTQEVPTSYPELVAVLNGVPAFAVSFAVTMMFWNGHWTWSRRYGLDDTPTVWLSAALVFVLLVYVYPMKYMYSLAIAALSGRFRQGVQGASPEEVYQLFAIYGAGFVAMALVLAALNLHALRVAGRLGLDEVERYLTRAELRSWLIQAGVGAASVTAALTTRPSLWMLPGWIYFLLPTLMPAHSAHVQNRTARMLQSTAR